MLHTMLLVSNSIPVHDVQFQQISTLYRQGIQCDVVFGSPSADCRGTGICKITGTNSFATMVQKKACQETSAIAVERTDGQGISLIFFRPLLCSQLYRRHFWKGILKMDEACPLPSQISDNMEQPFSQISAGRYQVVEENGYFRVDVDCQL
jgi:hypothetical protein